VEVDVSNHPSAAVARDLRTVRRVVKELIRLFKSWLPPLAVECMDAAVDEIGGAIDYIERAELKRLADNKGAQA
jgi:hypothetical protein